MGADRSESKTTLCHLKTYLTYIVMFLDENLPFVRSIGNHFLWTRCLHQAQQIQIFSYIKYNESDNGGTTCHHICSECIICSYPNNTCDVCANVHLGMFLLCDDANISLKFCVHIFSSVCYCCTAATHLQILP